MLVRLKRDFFLGGQLFKASRFGVELPDEVEGKPVIPYSEKPNPKGIMLPRDAEILSEIVEPKKAKDQPVALSQLAAAAKPKSFAEAMKAEDDED